MTTTRFALVLAALAASCAAPGADIIPADRVTVWNPGLNAVGGIPARTTISATVDAASYGNGASDATAGIQAALDACPVGQVVQLSAGTFMVTSELLITKGVVLRGMGPTQTKLKMNPVGANHSVIIAGTHWFTSGQSVSLAADAAKEATSVTLASNPGLAVGEIVEVDQLTDPNLTEWGSKSPPGDPSRGWFENTDRPIGQVVEITAISGTTITFSTPLHIAFTTANAAQLSRYLAWTGGPLAPTVERAGIEDLYVYGGGQGQGNIRLSNCAYSWIRNVESDYQDGEAIAIDGCFRCTVRDSYVHSTATPSPGGGGYGYSFSWYSADNLLENDISWNMNKVMVMRASGGGNVIGYCYFEDGWIDYATGWVECGANASHMTTPHYELFEGNQAFNFDGDNTWGNAIDITVFRNHFTAKRRSIAPLSFTDDGNRRAIGLCEGHWWYSFVANVIGQAGQSNPGGFIYQSSFPWNEDPWPMWKLGYNPNDWSQAADAKVLSTVLRHGNYDYATAAITWDPSISQHSMPDSLYLTAKPAFFGSQAWPWVTPEGPTLVASLPARQRFDAIQGLGGATGGGSGASGGSASAGSTTTGGSASGAGGSASGASGGTATGAAVPSGANSGSSSHCGLGAGALGLALGLAMAVLRRRGRSGGSMG